MAIYLPELDAVFTHIPKTGGTWVKAALAASGLTVQHARGLGEHNHPTAYTNPGKRFAFVRHPMTWIESAWRGLHSSWPARREVIPLHREKTWSPIRMLTYLAGDSTFDGFIETLLAGQRGFVSRMYEWYLGPPGCPTVDFVGRQEHLWDDLTQILRWLGWNGTLADAPPENIGPAVNVNWHSALRIRFLANEATAIQRWYGTNKGPWQVE